MGAIRAQIEAFGEGFGRASNPQASRKRQREVSCGPGPATRELNQNNPSPLLGRGFPPLDRTTLPVDSRIGESLGNEVPKSIKGEVVRHGCKSLGLALPPPRWCAMRSSSTLRATSLRAWCGMGREGRMRVELDNLHRSGARQLKSAPVHPDW